MMDDNGAQELVGRTIKEVFSHADTVAELHACLTSPRGNYFRLRLLQALEVPTDEAGIRLIKDESGVQEYHRHLNKFTGLGLAVSKEVDGRMLYTRTGLGERAINAIRQLERSISRQEVNAINAAALGPNSIRFFLRVYGDKMKLQWGQEDVQYAPAELGRLSLFLPRAIEGVSAMDKLNEAGLVVYRDDGFIYMRPVRARSFYTYLRILYEIGMVNTRPHGARWQVADGVISGMERQAPES